MSLRRILPCPFTASLLEELARYYDGRGCEVVLQPHADETREYAYAAVRTDRSLDLVRASLADARSVLDVVQTSPAVLQGVSPLEVVEDAVAEGAWG